MDKKKIFVLTVAVLMITTTLAAVSGGEIGPRGTPANADSEPNEDVADATNITAETITIPGTLDGGDDSDVYKIWLNNTGANAETVTFNCDFNRSNGVSIEVFDEAGIGYYIGYDDNADNVNVRVQSGFSQHYYINVSTQQVDGNYGLTVTKVSGVFGGNSNNHPDQASTVTGDNQPISQNIDGDVPNDMQDFYKINLASSVAASDLLIVYMQQPGAADYRLELYQSDAPGHYERVKYTPPNPGNDIVMSYGSGETDDYFIRVIAISGAGAYTVYIQKTSITKDNNNGYEFAEAITFTNDHSATIQGEVGESVDVEDWYSFEAVQGQFINISIDSLDYDAITDLPIMSITLFESDHINNYENESDPTLDPTGYTNGTVMEPPGLNYIKVFVIGGGGQYSMDILTDKPPVLNSGLEQSIHVMESTVNDTLDLDTVFTDPDTSDTLTFMVEKLDGGTAGFDDDTNVSITVDAQGVVTVTPKPGTPTGWTGSGPVKFTVRDPYDLEATAEYGIVVRGVNHEPYVLGPYSENNAFTEPVILLYDEMAKNTTINLKDVFADNDTGDLLNYWLYADNELWINRDTTTVIDRTVLRGANFNNSVRVSFAFEGNLVDHSGPLNIYILDDAKVAKQDHDVVVYFIAIDNGKPEMSSSMVKMQIMVRSPGGKEPEWDTAFTKVQFDEDNSTIVDFDEYIFDLDTADKDAIEYDVSGHDDNITVTKVDRSHYNFSAKANWNGEVTGVKVMATDTFGLTANTTIKVVVDSMSDAPVELKDKTSPDPTKKVVVDEGGHQNFTVEATDSDLDVGAILIYKWYIDDELQTTVINGTLVYKPGHDAAGEHTIQVVVVDDVIDTLGFNVTWTVEVLNINRAPTGVKIVSPEHNRTYKQGSKIEFNAQTAIDPDGDSLTYTWYANDKAMPDGDNQTFIYKKLKPGKHTIKLEVKDGNGGIVTEEIEIKIKKKEDSPGFQAIFLMAALVLVGMLYIRKRR